jgi:hypothetical protein
MSSDPSQLVLDDALGVVEAHALKGQVIQLEADVKRLMERHPDSMMTAAEIEAELVRLATKHGVAIGLSGSRPPSEP